MASERVSRILVAPTSAGFPVERSMTENVPSLPALQQKRFIGLAHSQPDERVIITRWPKTIKRSLGGPNFGRRHRSTQISSETIPKQLQSGDREECVACAEDLALVEQPVKPPTHSNSGRDCEQAYSHQREVGTLRPHQE